MRKIRMSFQHSECILLVSFNENIICNSFYLSLKNLIMATPRLQLHVPVDPFRTHLLLYLKAVKPRSYIGACLVFCKPIHFLLRTINLQEIKKKRR
jgi:hypothetical protein